MSKKLSTPITSSTNLTNKITNSLKTGNGIINSGDKIMACGLNIPINPSEKDKVITFLSDVYIHGGYHVVQTNLERDSIDCCYRKQGMLVVVVGEDLSYKEYRLLSDDCADNEWEEVIANVDIDVDESEVSLIQDYSEIAENITNQMLLNLAFKALILQIQTEVNNIDVPTNTSELVNDGEDGLNPFITLADIPPSTNVTNTSELINDGEDGIHPFITTQDLPDIGSVPAQITLTTSTGFTTETREPVTDLIQNGKNVLIDHGINNIVITTDINSPSTFIATYIKLGAGTVSFVAGAGTTLRQADGTNVLGNIAYQRCAVVRNGNEFILYISYA